MATVKEKGKAQKEEKMSEQTTRQELLGQYAGDEYLTADEIDELGLGPVSETGTPYSTDDMREDGVIFRISGDDQHEVEGYMVENMDSMEAGAILHRLI